MRLKARHGLVGYEEFERYRMTREELKAKEAEKSEQMRLLDK